MKTRLDLAVESNLLKDGKSYAVKQQKNVHELVEGYFESVIKPSKQNNILHLVDKLDKPVIAKKNDLKDLYYKENAKKYGF